MSTMKDIARIIADRYDIPRHESEQFVNDMFDVLKTELAKDEQVKIKGLGTFKIQTMQERASVDVNTGEKIVIDSHDRITFTPDAAMKESVNKPFAHFETVPINEGVVFDDIEDVPAQETTKVQVVETEVTAKEEPIVPEVEEVTVAASEVEEPMHVVPTPLFTIPEPTIEDKPKTEVEADLQTEVEDYNQTEVESDQQTEVESERQTPVETDQQTQVEADRQTEVETDQETQVETDRQTEVEPDGQTAIEQVNENIDTNMSNEYDDIDPSKDNDKMSGWLTALLAVLILVVGFVIGRATSDITFDDIKEAIYPTKQKPVQEKVEYLPLENDSIVPEETPAKEETDVKKEESKTEDAEKAPEEEMLTVPENSNVKTPATKPAAKPAEQETTKAPAPKTQATPATPKAEAKPEANVHSSQYDKDPRIRLGAYTIVGVQRTVTAKEGQTLSSISKAYLGPGMECYVEALNGIKEVKAGQSVKIPELKLKKKKNANK